jgi:Rod binding domain-containing protein
MQNLPPLSSGMGFATFSQSSVPPSGSGSNESIHHAASEFESILLNQWLEGAESTFGSVPGADQDEDAGDQQMKSFAVQALAKGITAAGGIGLANLVSKALTEREGRTSSEKGVTVAK